MVLCSPPQFPLQDPLGCRVLEGFLLLAAVGSCPALQKFDIPFLLEAQHVSLVDVVTANRSPAFLHLRDELGSACVCPAAAELDTPGQGLWKLGEGWTARLRAPANERPVGGWLGGQWSLHIGYHVSRARRVVTGSCVLGVNGCWLYFGTTLGVVWSPPNPSSARKDTARPMAGPETRWNQSQVGRSWVTNTWGCFALGPSLQSQRDPSSPSLRLETCFFHGVIYLST